MITHFWKECYIFDSTRVSCEAEVKRAAGGANQSFRARYDLSYDKCKREINERPRNFMRNESSLSLSHGALENRVQHLGRCSKRQLKSGMRTRALVAISLQDCGAC